MSHGRRRKVLVIGSGGREHALADQLLRSESVEEVIVAPGNAGTVTTPEDLARAAAPKRLRSTSEAPLDVVRRERIDLAVVGPEAPLVSGLADELRSAGVVTFGPSRAAAELEGSKAFMKGFAERHRLPTARHVVLTRAAEVEAQVRAFATPPVVKADGLCAGKGVVVAASHEEAIAAAEQMLSGALFGSAGARVVLEERLVGAEASVHALCDGERFVLLPAAQDHKRIFDGDRGGNTGGMGAYAPAPVVGAAQTRALAEDFFPRVLAGMAAEGRPFRGVLFAGLMITPTGEHQLIEFNVRFGDPETQTLLSVMDGDLAEALAAAAQGTLDPSALAVSTRHAMCVVLAAAGYPDSPRKGDVIRGLAEANAVPGVRVYHAGTAQNASGEVVTAGGRVLGVTGTGESLAEAHRRAYDAASKIDFSGMQYRRDIGSRALAPSLDATQHGR